MNIEEIKAGMCLKHTITGEIIQFLSVDIKKDTCTYSHLFSQTNKPSGYKVTRLSGFKIPFLLNFWEITKK